MAWEKSARTNPRSACAAVIRAGYKRCDEASKIPSQRLIFWATLLVSTLTIARSAKGGMLPVRLALICPGCEPVIGGREDPKRAQGPIHNSTDSTVVDLASNSCR